MCTAVPTIYLPTHSKKMGIEVTFVDQDLPLEELKKAIRPNTKAVFAETIANPALRVLDIEKFAALAQAAEAPLLIDNTFATPYFCRPIEFGANVVIHSTSKYLDGHAIALGGSITDGGNFNWNNGKYPQLSTPDQTYHVWFIPKPLALRLILSKHVFN